jgi:hypothetical protein
VKRHIQLDERGKGNPTCCNRRMMRLVHHSFSEGGYTSIRKHRSSRAFPIKSGENDKYIILDRLRMKQNLAYSFPGSAKNFPTFQLFFNCSHLNNIAMQNAKTVNC